MMSPGNNGNGFGEYRRLILSELQRLSQQVSDLDQKLEGFREDLVVLRTKAGIWGAIGGMVASGVLAALLRWFTR